MVTPQPNRPSAEPGFFQTPVEQAVGQEVARIFEESADPVAVRLRNFPRYVRRAHVTRFLALYEVFKLVLGVKGSVVECGVYQGFSLMSWAKLSAVLEPTNFSRRIYGFDSFAGFPSVSDQDRPDATGVRPGDYMSAGEPELRQLIQQFDNDRFLGHIPKVELIVGDVRQTIPHFLEENPQLVVSLLFLDLDLYEPTRLALDLLLPRVPVGGLVVFDELDDALFPGETLAVREAIGLDRLRLRRVELDPRLAYVIRE